MHKIYEHYKNLNTYEMIERIAQNYGDNPAISYLEGECPRSVTYNELFRNISALAAYFEAKDLKGKYIAIDMRNKYNQLVSSFAAMAMGAVAVLLNFDLPEEDLYYAIEKVNPDVLILDSEDEDFEFSGKEGLIRLSSDTDIPRLIAETAPLSAKPAVSAADPVAILLTSGSTSRSKLVVLPQSAMLPTDDVTTRRSISTLPLYHVAGIKFITNDLCLGSHVCLSDFRHALADIEWFRPKDAVCVPVFIKTLLRYNEKGLCDLSCFENIHSAGAAQDLELRKRLEALGIFSDSLYGATETGGGITTAYKEDFKEGSVGRIGIWTEVKLSKEGEILVRGQNVMLGYLGDEEATRAAFDGEWYKTGDLGRIDEDGFLFITGRLKNIIILSNGENVSPEAIEEKICRCGLIDEAVAYAEDDEIHLGIYCEDLDEQKRIEIEKYVKKYNKSVPTYHRIKKIDFRDKAFEKTASNKIKRPGRASKK